MKICGGNAISDCGNGNDKEEEYANESKWWQHGQVFKPKLRGRGSPIPIFVLRSSLKLFYNTAVHHRFAKVPNICITLLPQAFSQRCWASQICKRTQSSYYIALNIFFNAVHYGTANVHLKSILCGTMCLLPPNKDISENCEYCDRYLSNSTEHFSF